jgi:hypothetical protein
MYLAVTYVFLLPLPHTFTKLLFSFLPLTGAAAYRTQGHSMRPSLQRTQQITPPPLHFQQTFTSSLWGMVISMVWFVKLAKISHHHWYLHEIVE